jgi:ABC-2 type transport system permease protein/capsular polysaccharide transport system permease protein
VWHPAAYLLFPLSGAVFLVDALPAAAQKYVLYIPMVSGVEMVRDGYFGNQIRAHYDVPYLMGFCVVLTLLALAQITVVNRGITPE